MLRVLTWNLNGRVEALEALVSHSDRLENWPVEVIFDVELGDE